MGSAPKGHGNCFGDNDDALELDDGCTTLRMY